MEQWTESNEGSSNSEGMSFVKGIIRSEWAVVISRKQIGPLKE